VLLLIALVKRVLVGSTETKFFAGGPVSARQRRRAGQLRSSQAVHGAQDTSEIL
jgi:hypothetical protein